MIDPGKPFYLAWQFWLQMVMFIGIVANGVYSWWSNREKVTAGKFTDLEKDVARRVTEQALKDLNADRELRCNAHQKRTGDLALSVNTLTAEMKALPGHANLNKLHGRVDAVQKELSTMNGRLEGIGRTVELINEFLIKEGKR